MRKLILIWIFSLLTTSKIFSQSSFEIGLTSGPELNFPSSFNKEIVRRYQTTPGFNIGLKLRHNFGMYSFVWGFEYAQMKFVYQNDPNPDPYFYMNYQETMNLVADQFRIPLLFQINVGKRKSQFFASGGPGILFGTARYPDRRDITFGDNESTLYYPGEIIREINIGFMTGAGYSYKPTPWLRLFTEARFTLPIFANNDGGGSINDIRTLGLSWSLGVSFKTSPK